MYPPDQTPKENERMMPSGSHRTPPPGLHRISTSYISDEESESTPMPQSVCQNSGSDGCPMAERVNRIERTLDVHTRDLGKGAVTMTRLEGNLNRFADTLDRLDAAVAKFGAKVDQPNRYGEMIISALIQWGVPVAVVAIIWALINSGAVVIAKGTP